MEQAGTNNTVIGRPGILALPFQPAQARQSLLPIWFRQEISDPQKIAAMRGLLHQSRLHTVCESALCPNLGKCWSQGVATFMILGDVCTRACRFCAVAAGKPLAVDPHEPRHVAEAVQHLALRYVVITSVARDDLPDEGAEHFCQTIEAIRRLSPETKIEILIPDFSNKPSSLQHVVDAWPDVISHNLETVARLSPLVRPQADYQRSLEVLANLKRLSREAVTGQGYAFPAVISKMIEERLAEVPANQNLHRIILEHPLFTKSSLMVGLGETEEELVQAMKDLRAVDCDILTIGQYLAPTKRKRHLPVTRFVHPDEFARYQTIGLSLGFKHVMSGPLVRSSFIAEEGYRECFEKVSQDQQDQRVEAR